MTGAPSFPLSEAEVTALVRDALDEDAAFDDVTTIATVPADRRARANLVAREPGVICGVALALEAFRICDRSVELSGGSGDGALVARGATVFTVAGPARGMLAAERTALNFLQHLSGIATLTRRYVDAVQGSGAAILDTRKTTPGWRRLEKYAVRCGGGANHRFGLADAVLIKDNHLAAVDGDIALAVHRVRDHAVAPIGVEVECDRVEQVHAAVAAGADIVLLDNMSLKVLRECVAVAKGHCATEASGGVRVETVRAIAETGVDRISVGALTHSAPALNLALDFE